MAKLNDIKINVSLNGELDYDKIAEEVKAAVKREVERVGVKAEIVPETITHNGAEYKRVDRKAQEGDVVVFSETGGNVFENGNPYLVNSGVKVCGGGFPYLVYRPEMNRTESNVKVYEPVAQPLKVGDYAKIIVAKYEYKVGDIVKLTSNHDSRSFDFGVEYVIVTGTSRCEFDNTGYVDRKMVVRATDEEVAEAKRQQAEQAIADKWSAIGRKPNEFKKGDIVLVTEEGTHEFDEGETVTIYDIVDRGSNPYRCRYVNGDTEEYDYLYEYQLRLITPVEHRFDLAEGDSE
jgi:hypothetical protein